MDVRVGGTDEAARDGTAGDGALVATLVVSPFVHHGRLRRFVAALEERPGVLHVRPGRVRAGAVWLTVHHAGDVPLRPQLESLTEFGPRVEFDGGRWLVYLADEDEEGPPSTA